MLAAKLVVVGGDAQQAEIDLKLPLLVGRGRDVALTVPHALVSRRHCEIIERTGRLVVRDLGSLNGTFVNNQRIETEQILEPDQLLTLGTVTFRAVYRVSDVPSEELATADTTTLSGIQTVSSLHSEGGQQIESSLPMAAPWLATEDSDYNEAANSKQHLPPVSSDSGSQILTIPLDSFQAAPDEETLPQEPHELEAGDSSIGSFFGKLPR